VYLRPYQVCGRRLIDKFRCTGIARDFHAFPIWTLFALLMGCLYLWVIRQSRFWAAATSCWFVAVFFVVVAVQLLLTCLRFLFKSGGKLVTEDCCSICICSIRSQALSTKLCKLHKLQKLVSSWTDGSDGGIYNTINELVNWIWKFSLMRSENWQMKIAA